MKKTASDNRVQTVLRGLITPLCAGIILAILAPYSTNNFSLPNRLLYWVGLCLAGGIGAIIADQLISKLSTLQLAWQRALAQSIGATIAVAPFVLSIHDASQWQNFFLTLFYIWVIAIVISIVAELLRERFSDKTKEPDNPPLLDRLPPKFRNSALFAISAEDHYVRIHSAAGEHMLLMRLSDAEDFAAPLTGLKPHRSWWVSENGVETVIKSSGKLKILLKSGTEVPVSREGAKRVRDAGWV